MVVYKQVYIINDQALKNSPTTHIMYNVNCKISITFKIYIARFFEVSAHFNSATFLQEFSSNPASWAILSILSTSAKISSFCWKATLVTAAPYILAHRPETGRVSEKLKEHDQGDFGK